MNLAHMLIRWSIAIVAAFALVGVGSASALPADTTSITIHKSTCPANTGSDIFERCHGNALAGIDFDIKGSAVTTDALGHATAVVASGSVTITENPADAAHYAGAYVFCSVQGSGKILTDGPVTTGAVTITTAAGDEVICDWYNLTNEVVNTPTVGPSPTATATSVPVVQPTAAATSTSKPVTLPNTGAGDSGGSGSATFWIAGLFLAVIAGTVTLRRRKLT